MNVQVQKRMLLSSWPAFLKTVAAIAIPVALQNLLSTTGSMVDTMMLAKLDENVKGAVGLCAKYSNLMFSGYWGFVAGGMLFMSQYWGAKNEKGLCRAFGLMLLSMLISVGIFSGMAAFAPMTVMRILTDKEEYWSIGAEYLRICSIAYILQVFSTAFSAMLRSMERVKIPLIASVAAVLTNFTANEILIFGRFGFPRLGIRGAAIGTVLAGIVNLTVLLIMAYVKNYRIVFQFRDHFQQNKAFVKQFLIKSFPILINEILIGIGNFIISIVLGRQSTDMINALAIFNVFEGFVISFFSGFTIASSVLVGKEIGAGNHETAYQSAKRLVLITPTVVFLACITVCFFHKPILTAMGLSGNSFILGRGMLSIFTVAATIRMTNWIQNDTFRSAGDAVRGTVLEISFMYALLIPLLFLSAFVFHWPPLAVFACCYVDEPIRVVLMLKHLFSGKWVRPVTEEGIASLDAFRKNHHIVIKNRRKQQ